MITDILRMLDEYHSQGIDIKIHWFYDLEDAEIKQNLVATGEPATNQGQLKREMGMVSPA